MQTKNLLIIAVAIILLTGCQANKKAISAGPEVLSGKSGKMMIVAKLTVKPEKADDFIAAARSIIALSNLEGGCISYQLFQDPYDTSRFVFVEEYKNQDAVDAHFATEHFKAFGGKIGDMVAGPPEIRIITVAGEVIK
jgi:quinol monooxygenase YgiN